MTALADHVLDRVVGGGRQRRHATPEQIDTFKNCWQRADDKSVFKPWTWSRRGHATCITNLKEAIRGNAPT